MILLTHNMLASPMKEAAKQLPLGNLVRQHACHLCAWLHVGVHMQ